MYLFGKTLVLLLFILVSGIILAGCIITVPVPVPGPGSAPVQCIPCETTPGEGTALLLQTGIPTTEPITPLETGAPVPVPTFFFRNPLPQGSAYTYADNLDFHSLSVNVENCQKRARFYFTPGGSGARLTSVDPIPGLKFLIIGVDFHMTGIRQEGKSSTFMTPLATSFQLMKGTESYKVLNASDITGMTDYYLRDIGSLYRDRFITKDDPGSGVLIFVVNQSFDPTGAYITFCPRNLESWASFGYYRSPDNWDCERNLVVWQLR